MTLDTRHSTRDTELVHFSYDFDPASNVKAIHDERLASAVALTDKRRNTQNFTYDDLYRLTRVQYNLPNPSPDNGGQINYRFDRIGNMLSQTSDIVHSENGFPVANLGSMQSGGGPGGRSDRFGRSPGEPPGPHALTSIENRSYQYDAMAT